MTSAILWKKVVSWVYLWVTGERDLWVQTRHMSIEAMMGLGLRISAHEWRIWNRYQRRGFNKNWKDHSWINTLGSFESHFTREHGYSSLSDSSSSHICPSYALSDLLEAQFLLQFLHMTILSEKPTFLLTPGTITCKGANGPINLLYLKLVFCPTVLSSASCLWSSALQMQTGKLITE